MRTRFSIPQEIAMSFANFFIVPSDLESTQFVARSGNVYTPSNNIVTNVAPGDITDLINQGACVKYRARMRVLHWRGFPDKWQVADRSTIANRPMHASSKGLSRPRNKSCKRASLSQSID